MLLGNRLEHRIKKKPRTKEHFAEVKVYGREKQQENTDYILIFLFVSPRDQPLLQQFYSM